jgi:uncharacterized protein YndB with AHSA1/START domain
MAASNVSGSAATNIVDRQLVLTRVFDAPRELVFKAWTETERLKRWWGPKGFTNPVCELDARPGGSYSNSHARAGRHDLRDDRRYTGAR